MKEITLVGWNQEQSVIDGLNSVFVGRYNFTQSAGDNSVLVDGEAFKDLRIWDEEEGCTILDAWFELRFQGVGA